MADTDIITGREWNSQQSMKSIVVILSPRCRSYVNYEHLSGFIIQGCKCHLMSPVIIIVLKEGDLYHLSS